MERTRLRAFGQRFQAWTLIPSLLPSVTPHPDLLHFSAKLPSTYRVLHDHPWVLRELYSTITLRRHCKTCYTTPINPGTDLISQKHTHPFFFFCTSLSYPACPLADSFDVCSLTSGCTTSCCNLPGGFPTAGLAQKHGPYISRLPRCTQRPFQQPRYTPRQSASAPT